MEAPPSARFVRLVAAGSPVSFLPAATPTLRLPGIWSDLDKLASHLPKEKRIDNARRWAWRWSEAAELLHRQVIREPSPVLRRADPHPELRRTDPRHHQVAGGGLLRLAVAALSCDWPDLDGAAGGSYQPWDEPPEAMACLWRALSLRSFGRPTVHPGTVLATWNWRLHLSSQRTGRPYRPAELLLPGAVRPLYSWPGATSDPEMAGLLAVPPRMLAAVASLPRAARALHESGYPSAGLRAVLADIECSCLAIRRLLATAQRTLVAADLTSVQLRVLRRIVEPYRAAKALAAGRPQTEVGPIQPLSLAAPWALLGGEVLGNQAVPPQPVEPTDEAQGQQLALLHMVGRDLAHRFRTSPSAYTAHTRAVEAWTAAEREYRRWITMVSG